MYCWRDAGLYAPQTGGAARRTAGASHSSGARRRRATAPHAAREIRLSSSAAVRPYRLQRNTLAATRCSHNTLLPQKHLNRKPYQIIQTSWLRRELGGTKSYEITHTSWLQRKTPQNKCTPAMYTRALRRVKIIMKLSSETTTKLYPVQTGRRNGGAVGRHGHQDGRLGTLSHTALIGSQRG